jgi:hypothetical protein
MASLVRLSLLAWLLFIAAVVSDAAMIYDVNLYNASGRSVDLMYMKTGGKWTKWATIPPGHSKTFSYYGGVALRDSARLLSYSRVDPPGDYISAGLFSVSFKAQLTPDLRIYLLPPSASFPWAHLPSQPKGFPLAPVTQRSNQAMQRTADHPYA